MRTVLFGALIGLGLAAGILMVVTRSGQLSIARRVLPHVQASGFEWTQVRPPKRLASNHRVRRLFDFFTSDRSVQQRLQRSNSSLDLETFRLDQIKWASIGLGVAIAIGLLRALGGKPIAPIPWLFLCIAATLAGVFLRDWQLSRAARQRVQAINQELPVFAELLAFTVAAGLAPASALNRVADKIGGALSQELQRCSDSVAVGQPFAEALQDMADRIGSAEVQRFVDGIVVSTQRGTPISDVLRAQAMDARSASHRELMEEASKREIFALIPVVFLILPVVVIVAVYPGVVNLVV